MLVPSGIYRLYNQLFSPKISLNNANLCPYVSFVTFSNNKFTKWPTICAEMSALIDSTPCFTCSSTSLYGTSTMTELVV